MLYTGLGINDPGFLSKILRPFLAGIDVLIYKLVGWILSGIFELSSMFANAEFAQTIYRNIYIILAVFMVFKLTFSFIQFLVSPDKMVDKDQGVGKIIINTILMLLMLVALPILFFQKFDFGGTDKNGNPTEETILQAVQQGMIETLPSIILGQEVSDPAVMQNEGDMMAINMFSALCYPEDKKDAGDAFKSFNKVTDIAMKEKGSGGGYKYHYMWPITTIAGIVLVVTLIGIAIDVAVRAFKLIILQVIAPIPVMTYIDPKSSKDGAFNSWIKNFISTYIDLFVKLGSVYVLLLLIQRLNLFNDNTEGLFDTSVITDDMTGKFVKVFLVIGLFKFAKDAPKFIKDALGIKDNGGGGGFMGKALAGMAGAAAGFAGGVASGGGIRSGLSGGLSGFSAGVENAGSGKPTRAYSQVRDQQAKALGKQEGGIRAKLQNRGIQKTIAKKTGLNENTLEAAKNNMLAAQAHAKELHARFERGDDVDWTDVNNADEAAEAAQKNYERAKTVGDAIGLGAKSFVDKNKILSGPTGAAYKAVKKAKGEVSVSKGSTTIDVQKGVRGEIDKLKENVHDKIAGSRGNKVREWAADRITGSQQQKSESAAKKGGFDPNKRS